MSLSTLTLSLLLVLLAAPYIIYPLLLWLRAAAIVFVVPLVWYRIYLRAPEPTKYATVLGAIAVVVASCVPGLLLDARECARRETLKYQLHQSGRAWADAVDRGTIRPGQTDAEKLQYVGIPGGPKSRN